MLRMASTPQVLTLAVSNTDSFLAVILSLSLKYFGIFPEHWGITLSQKSPQDVLQKVIHFTLN